jgi:hypothetical protein
MKPRRQRRLAADEIAPTTERQGHDRIERFARPIADEAGRSARPFRVVDTLALMLAKATITPAMHQAAEDFRALFAAAHLEPLRAADWARLPDGAHDMPVSLRQADARKKIWTILKSLGGIASPAGSCVWHVVGCEWTVKDWATSRGWNGRPLRLEHASGILVGSLAVLQAQFGL